LTKVKIHSHSPAEGGNEKVFLAQVIVLDHEVAGCVGKCGESSAAANSPIMRSGGKILAFK